MIVVEMCAVPCVAWVGGLAMTVAFGCGQRPISGTDAEAGDAPAESATDAAVDTAPVPIGDRTFGNFEPWARPIDDFRAVGQAEFPTSYVGGIHDLAPFGGFLWLGYGDANNNLGGFVPIEFRAFASADDPAAMAFVVDAAGQGAVQDTPTRSGEEQIDRYRMFDGQIWQAGIDSIDADEMHTQTTTNPRAIDGNMYRLVGNTWVKRRSIRGGEHVHDLAGWRGAVYAVGSGADLRSEFEAGQIFRYLWRSDNRGDAFVTVQRIQHPTPRAGDTRWVHLLSTTSMLWAFGYESEFATGVARVSNARYDGAAVTVLAAADALGQYFALGTAPLPDGAGLVHGVNVAVSPRRHTVLRVGGDGGVTTLDAFRGHTLRDVIVSAETGEIVYLTTLGDGYPGPPMPATYDATVWVAPLSDPNATRAIAHHVSSVALSAIAYWRGALFLGAADGRVLRAR